MEEMDTILHLNGVGFRIAESPEQLIAAGGTAWNYPPHWNADALEAVADAWPQSIGIAFETGGALMLEALGEGVYQLVGSVQRPDPDAAVKLRAGILFAFCATDCRRLLSQVDDELHAVMAVAFGLNRYGTGRIASAGGSIARHYLAADLDEFAAAMGHELFHAQASEFGLEDKALRVIERWTRHTGDTYPLNTVYLQELDPANWRVDAAQLEASRAGFQWTATAAHWIEHGPECGVPAGARECACAPVIGFTNGQQTATVGPDGNVLIAMTH